MLGKASNPMLAQAEEGTQAKVPQELQPALAKVVGAGLTVLYSPKNKENLMKKLQATTDAVSDAANGAARMMSNLFQQSGKSIPPPVIMPATAILAYEYLDLVSKAGKVEITPDVVAKTAAMVNDVMLPLMGVTPDKMKEVVGKAQQGQQAPPNSIMAQAQQAQPPQQEVPA